MSKSLKVVGTLPYTPHTRMMFRAIVRKALDWYQEAAVEYDVEPRLIDEIITDYAMLCARAPDLNGQVDFKLTKSTDTPEQMRGNFRDYMSSQCMDTIRRYEQEMMQMDAPQDAALAPGAEPEGEA